ncbi:MAG: DUF5057 domain-containing protein, partial [Clostridiales bacterium]|nr:DUF5057 domain-containing protein [Clostridiales bacterium]
FSVDPDTEIPDYLNNNIGHRVILKRKGPYIESNRYIYENKDLFLKKVLGKSDEQIKDYQIVVKTVIPSDLEGHADYIDRADLIYINSTCHYATNPSAFWTTYNKLGLPNDDGSDTFSDTNDLSWDIVCEIMKMVTKGNGKHRTALLMDHKIYTNASSMFSAKSVNPKQITYDGNKSTHGYSSACSGYKANIYKLFFMTHFMDANAFSNLYLSDIDGQEPATIPGIIAENMGSKNPLIDTNGTFLPQGNTDEGKYWCKETFLMTKPDGSRGNSNSWHDSNGEMWKNFRLNYQMNDTENLNKRVFSVKGDHSLAYDLSNDTLVGITDYTKCLEQYANDKGSTNTVALAIQYILDQTQGISDEITRDLDVLELQPCADFDLTEFRVRMWLPQSSGTIRLYHQTTNEFVGHIEDINAKYELIYMGMNTGKFVTDSSGKTKYNPNGAGKDLTGKVYLHVGGKVTTQNDSEIGPKNQRLYYDLSTKSWINPPGISPNKNNYDVRLPGNDITELKKDALISYLSANYPIVAADSMYNDYSVPKENCKIDKYSYIYQVLKEGREGSLPNFMKYSQVNTDATHELSTYVREYRPTLTVLSAPPEYKGADESGVAPDSSYINGGSNHDYHYLKFKYRLDGTDPTRTYRVQLLVDKNSDGKFTDKESLGTHDYSGGTKQDEITWDLGSDYVGAVAWKLTLVDQTDSKKRDEVTGVCARKNYEAREEVRILQIINDGANNWDLRSTSGLFYQYTQNLTDFKLTVTQLKTSDINALYNTTPYNKTDPSTDQFKDYDMLIFGFADMYTNISNDRGALDNVKDYINSGKSVMFTHDVTSYKNAPANPNLYGYGFNINMRTALCMDRFGCRIPRADKTDDTKSISDKCTDPFGGTYSEDQGFTYYAIKRMLDSDSGRVRIFKDLPYSEDNGETQKATKINNGQLTRYPYNIPDGTITTAKTHGQYYQLDMNDPELVVWYALDGGPNDLYSVSPKDASNNYYIYNCGNVTYTGVGHKEVDGGSSSPYEIKLFVNTMIAAYKNSVGAPTLDIVNADFQGSGSNYYLYIDSDAQARSEEPGTDEFEATDMLPIKFKIRAHGLSNGDNMGVRISTESVSGGAYVIKQLDSAGNIVNSGLTTTYGGTSDFLKVVNGVTYMIEYPKNDFNNKNVKKITFQLKNDEGDESIVYVNIMRRTLFKLN